MSMEQLSNRLSQMDLTVTLQASRFIVKEHVDEELDELKRTFHGLPGFLVLPL